MPPIMRMVYKITAYLLVLFGIVYVALTPLFFRHFGLEVLWFAGTGLGLVFLGNMNLIVLLNRRSAFYMMVITSNVMALLLMVVILAMSPAPQAYIGLGLTLVITITSVNEYVRLVRELVRETSKKQQQEEKAGEED